MRLVKVRVKLYANLRRYLPPSSEGGNRLELELEEGTTIGGLLEKLKIPPREAKSVFVNSVLREESYVLREGDEVGIFSPIGGGST